MKLGDLKILDEDSGTNGSCDCDPALVTFSPLHLLTTDTACIPASPLQSAAARIRRVPTDIAAIVFVVLLQVVYFTGFVASDDNNYLDLVHHLQTGQAVPPHLDYFKARFVHWLTVYAAVTILPNVTWAIAMPPLLATLGLLILIRAYARRELPNMPPALPVLLFGLVPIAVINASVAMPDPIATLLGWLGLYIAAPALLRQDTPEARWRCLVGGIVTAMGFNAKESIAIIIPACGLFVLLCRTRCWWAWTRTAWVGLGGLVWVAFSMIVLGWWTGDPFFQSKAVAMGHRIAGWPCDPSLYGVAKYSLDYLRWLMNPFWDFSFVGVLLLLGMVVPIIKRTAFTNLLLCVVIPAFVYLSAGSSEWSTYHPLDHQTRYLLPFLPGMALLAAAWIDWFRRTGRWQRQIAHAAIALVIIAGAIAPNRLAGRWYHAETFAACFDMMRTGLPEKTESIAASQLSRNRFVGMDRWMEMPRIELILGPPRTAADWVDRFGGQLVVVTPVDRRRPNKHKHADAILYGSPISALSRFEKIATVAPPRDRLSTLWARLRGKPVPRLEDEAVELYRVPSVEQWQAEPANTEPDQPATDPRYPGDEIWTTDAMPF